MLAVKWARAGIRIARGSALVICAIVVFLILQRGIEALRQHEHRLHLYRRASGVPPDWKGSDDEVQAVHELGDDPSAEASRMLIDLATHPRGLLVFSQEAAISELGKRKNPDIPPILAALIQTGTPSDSRRAAAQALQTLPCNAQCSRSLLDYLSRIDSGELNAEDQVPEDVNSEAYKDVEAEIIEDQQEIYGLVYSVLMHAPDTTNMVLTQDYGLGTATPKKFALTFVTREHNQSFCPALIQAQRRSQSGLDASVRTSVAEAAKTLQCGTD